MLTALLLTALTPVAFAADCTSPVRVSAITTDLERVERAFGAMDPTVLELGALLLADLECLREPLSPQQAAGVHRAVGLIEWLHDRPTHTEHAFAAARKLEPDYAFPDWLVPPGAPVLEAWNKPLPIAEVDELAPPAEGRLVLDGATATSRPVVTATIWQHERAAGAVHLTAYLWPESPTPEYTTAEARIAKPAPEERPDGGKSKGPRRIVAGVGGALVAAGAYSYGSGWYANGYLAGHPDSDVATSYYDSVVRPRVMVGLGLIGVGVASIGTATVVLEADGLALRGRF